MGDLPGAQQDPLHRGRVAGEAVVVEDLAEAAALEVGDRRAGRGHAQVPLRGEAHERLAGRRVALAAQHVEVLRRGRRVADPQVVLRAQGEEPLDAGARVLGALALEAVGEEQREPGLLAPLVLGGDDELVDDDLRAVDEVAELRLPADPRVGVGDGVAVLEAERRVLGEHGVVEHERRLAGGDVLERAVLRLVLGVDEHAVALAERPPPGVLAGESHRGALQRQRAEREGLGERPVDLVGAEVGLAGPQDLLQLRVHVEVVGPAHERADDLLQRGAPDPRLHRGLDVVGHHDVDRDRRRSRGVRLLERVVEPRVEVVEGLLGLRQREVAAVDERLGVELAHRPVRPDQLVHLRLGERGLVALVVAEAAVADHVDDDVLAERLAEVERHLHDAHARLGVVAVDVEDRRLHHLGDVGGVHARPAELGRGGEAELVVHHDVDGAADLVAGHLAQVERLGDHALTRERGVTVHEDGEHVAALAVVDPVALGAGHALDHGVDRLEVARVRREGHGARGARRRDVPAGRADVVLHVARALHRRRVERALELAEDLAVALPDGVHEHVEPAAVRHAEDDLGHAAVGRGRQQRVEHRDERLRALEAEPLLAQVLRVEEALERLGRVEPVEDAALHRGVGRGVRALDPALDPLLLLGLLDVHELDADRARVGVAQHAEDVAQGHRAGPDRSGAELAGGEGPDRELAVEVPDRQAVVVDVELGVGVGLAPAERVEVRDQVPAHPVHVDQLVDVHDLLVRGRLVVERADVGAPARRLVRDREAPEDVVVELVARRAAGRGSRGGTRRSRRPG